MIWYFAIWEICFSVYLPPSLEIQITEQLLCQVWTLLQETINWWNADKNQMKVLKMENDHFMFEDIMLLDLWIIQGIHALMVVVYRLVKYDEIYQDTLYLRPILTKVLLLKIQRGLLHPPHSMNSITLVLSALPWAINTNKCIIGW